MKELTAALRYAIKLRKDRPTTARKIESYLRELPKYQQSNFSRTVAEILKVLEETA